MNRVENSENSIIKRRYVVYMLYMVFAVMAVSGGTLSSYKARVSTSNTTRIAMPEVNPVLEVSTGSIQKPGDFMTFPFSVSNQNAAGVFTSEVAMSYLVQVVTTNNLPLNITLVKSTGGANLLGSMTTEMITDADGSQRQVAVWEQTTAATIGLRSQKDQYTLKLEWPADRNDPAYAGMLDQVKVVVKATQMDNYP